MMNAILEGYPKSKKDFLVSAGNFSPPILLFSPVLVAVFLNNPVYLLLLLQDEVGVETDEDYKVTVPSI